MPSALTAASRTSTTSQRNNGTTNLYIATGEADAADDLSLRSVVNESGDELKMFENNKNIVLVYSAYYENRKI